MLLTFSFNLVIRRCNRALTIEMVPSQKSTNGIGVLILLGIKSNTNFLAILTSIAHPFYFQCFESCVISLYEGNTNNGGPLHYWRFPNIVLGKEIILLFNFSDRIPPKESVITKFKHDLEIKDRNRKL